MAAQITIRLQTRPPKLRIALVKTEYWGVEQIRKVTPHRWTNWWISHIFTKQVPWLARRLRYSWDGKKWRTTLGRKPRAKRQADQSRCL